MEAFPLGFGYYRQRTFSSPPRSLQGALLALHQGTLVPEGLAVYMSDLKPVLEGPYDLAAFDRMLSRPSLDLASALRLMEIFRKLTADQDLERALFGAESMNAVEVRFGKAAQEAAGQYAGAAGDDRGPALRRLLRAQFRLALLNRNRPAILRFYCLECLRTWAAARSWFRLRLSDTILLVGVYRELGRYDRARKLLEACGRRGLNHLRLDLLRADLAFRAGDGVEVCRALAAIPGDRRTARIRSLAAFWGLSAAGGPAP